MNRHAIQCARLRAFELAIRDALDQSFDQMVVCAHDERIPDDGTGGNEVVRDVDAIRVRRWRQRGGRDRDVSDCTDTENEARFAAHRAIDTGECD